MATSYKIVCCGNLLRGDDGAGVHIYNELSRQPLPKYVEVIDAGTGCFRILNLLDGCDKIIFIDAMKGRNVGKIHRLTERDIEVSKIAFTMHEFKPEHLINEINHTFEKKPEIVIFGIEVSKTDEFSMELTEPVKMAVPAVIGAVLKEVK